ncbi:hypothetical protein OF897_00815 [Chryseobacterium formosus]|uniref:Uncharacterized protein n=1 Tax=Chryseobacterium formosus TaxID=1537363 RepID=A0ABT3XK08_9FLAO|nr:hypothetical protein [Chryseobacterium formosus]MCX8522464.1 hypothetical protein [Chryseobacterium formosus]
MNTSKDNFEFQIKRQIDEREITPSRDLWAEIQAQTENTRSKKSNINWVLLAACFVLIFGLGAVLFLNNDSEPKPQMAETEKTPSLKEENTIKQPERTNSQNIIVKDEQERFTQTKDLPSELQTEKEVPHKNELPLIKENPSEIASQIIIQNQPAKIMAKSDSVKVQKKRRYVDPSTLLFSVEHKDVIDKSKDGSNVATIDLNTK